MEIQKDTLIRRAQTGDTWAISQLYQENYDDIYNYIFYRVSDHQATEDISSEVFIRMIRALPSYQERGKPLQAWLYTIARNLVIDHYRYVDKVEEVPFKDQLLEDLSGSPAKRIQQLQDGKCFIEALRHLTEDQQNVVIHRFIEEHSTSVTAELIGKTTRAVRSLQHRALRSLEKALTEENCL
jgi:RNA polymerase sigma-70 factor (ECF subfamily)